MRRINYKTGRTDRKGSLRDNRKDRIGLKGRTDRKGRIGPTGRTDPQEITGITAGRKAAVTAGPRAGTARVAGPTADSIREEEVQVQMAGLRETGKTDFREAAGRVLKAARVIAVVQALVQAAIVILTAAREITEEMSDREPVPEIQEAAKALQGKLRQKIWKRGVMMTSAAQTTRRGISAPGKTTFMRKTRR